MKTARKQRLAFMISLLLGASIAIGLALFALSQNINLFFTPAQIARGQAPKDHAFRLGGIVAPQSVKHAPHSLAVQFVLVDKNHDDPIQVYYNGILPALFREGQGIVAEGKLSPNGVFIASQVLAKHDENYRPLKS